MSVKQLNQIIAVEKGVKSRTCSVVTDLHRVSSKLDLFNGFTKTYKKKDEEGEDYPQEKKKVVNSVKELLDTTSQTLTELFNVTATKDFANCSATADLIVEGKLIVKDAPATYLLFLEKQINDIRTFIEALPVLDEAEDWTLDVNSGQYKTGITQTHKTKKVQKPITLAEATKEHPAQVSVITEDVIIGYWDTVKYSGSIPLPEKKEILARVEKLNSAVKCAREKANTVEAPDVFVGRALFDYLLN